MKKLFYTIIIFGSLLWGMGAHGVQTGLTGVDQEHFRSYTRHHDVQSSEASQGATAPTPVTIGTARCLGFDADAEVVFLNIEIPSEWDGASDMIFRIHWISESGDALADGETVKWDATYRANAPGVAIDNGTAVTATATHTQVGAGIDKEHLMTNITIDYDNVNQPLIADNGLYIQFNRDMSGDTYTGDGVVCRWDLQYTANKLPTH